MSRGKHFNHKEKGHPGDFPKNSIVSSKEEPPHGKPIENIIPAETYKNRINTD